MVETGDAMIFNKSTYKLHQIKHRLDLNIFLVYKSYDFLMFTEINKYIRHFQGENGFKAGKKRKASEGDSATPAKKPYSNFVKVFLDNSIPI